MCGSPREAVPDLREQGIPDDVADVISAAMARDPGQRPSPLQLGQQLQQLQASHGYPVDEMALHDPTVPAAGGGIGHAPGTGARAHHAG